MGAMSHATAFLEAPRCGGCAFSGAPHFVCSAWSEKGETSKTAYATHCVL